jgi:hypothetical protein
MGKVETNHPSKPVPWSLLGHAIDYRLRFYFSHENIDHLVACLGAQRACGASEHLGRSIVFSSRMQGFPEEFEVATLPGYLDPSICGDFFASLKKFMLQIQPSRQRLSRTDEDLLLRYCVILGAFEVFFRYGFDERSILLTPHPKQSLVELLAVVEDHWLEDLRNLSWAFYEKFQSSFDVPTLLGPTFVGSRAVGGADADFIVGNCLIDIKTTINPFKKLPFSIYQLLGYMLLDWEDNYQIDEVAIYFSRQCFLLKWKLDELIAELAGSDTPSLGELRKEWHKIVTRVAKTYS